METARLPVEQIDTAIDLALNEDTACGDITSEALVPPELTGKAAVGQRIPLFQISDHA